MSIIRLIFVAALASFAVANVDEVSNDASFAEATAFVQSFSSTNEQGDSACLKVANDAIKVIADECKTLQVVINTAAQANQKCCKSGSLATCKAKGQHTSSIGAHSKCLSQLDTIKNKNVNLGSVSYSSLARKTCNGQVVVPKNSQFKAIKSEVEKKTTECQKNSGIKATAKKFYEDQVKTAASERTTCNDAAQAALTKAFTNGKAACGSARNLKAFTRAEHMKCVLKGTKLADCSMPKPPGVKKTTLSTLNCAAQTGDSSQCLKALPQVWVTFNKLRMYKVKVLSKYGSMLNKNANKNGTPSFIKACGAYGLKPVCNSGSWANAHCLNPYFHLKYPKDKHNLASPRHDNVVGFPLTKAIGIFWFTGTHGAGSLYNTGSYSTHPRWVTANDKNGYTLCGDERDRAL